MTWNNYVINMFSAYSKKLQVWIDLPHPHLPPLPGLEINLFCSGASWRLTEKFWLPVRKFWSPTYFICNLHKNMILYVTLHARKVTID